MLLLTQERERDYQWASFDDKQDSNGVPVVGTRELVSVFAIRVLPDLDTREVLCQNIATDRSGLVYFKVSAESYTVGEMCTLQLRPEGGRVHRFYEQRRSGGVKLNTT